MSFPLLIILLLLAASIFHRKNNFELFITTVAGKALDQISLANISQYLLISMGSLRLLARQLLQKDSSWGTNSWVSTEDGEGFEDAGSQPVSKETEFKLAQVVFLMSSQHCESEDTGELNVLCEILQVVEDLIWRFRPNLVITDEDVGAPQLSPYEEETWEEVRIGSIPFKVTIASLYHHVLS